MQVFPFQTSTCFCSYTLNEEASTSGSLFISSVAVKSPFKLFLSKLWWAEELLSHPSPWHIHWSSHTFSACRSRFGTTLHLLLLMHIRLRYYLPTFSMNKLNASVCLRTWRRVSSGKEDNKVILGSDGSCCDMGCLGCERHVGGDALTLGCWCFS